MRQLASGSYSDGFEHDGVVMKFIHTPSATEAQRRCSDVEEYVRLLGQAGVNVPQTKVVVIGSVLIVVMALAPGENAYTHLQHHQAAGDTEKFYAVFDACCAEVIRLIGALHHTERPVGYDASPENFVVDRDRQRAACVDVYPPRLGFALDETGNARRLPEDELLVDYVHHEQDKPEGGRAQRPRWGALRRAYYDAVGLVEHCIIWFAACGMPDPSAQGQACALALALGTRAIGQLRAAGLDVDAHAVEAGLSNTSELEVAMAYRLGRIADRRWEVACGQR